VTRGLASNTVLVAGVAVHAVVDVPAHSLMPAVGLRLRMAVRALKDGVVVRIGVTDAAYAICIAVIQVEPGVVKRGSRPIGGGVTGRASCGEAGRRMVRIRCALVVGLMTAVAIRG